MSGNRPGENLLITYPPVESNVYQNIYFLFKKKTHTQTQTHEQNANGTKEEKRKTKETKEEKEKENFAVLNGIWKI